MTNHKLFNSFLRTVTYVIPYKYLLRIIVRNHPITDISRIVNGMKRYNLIYDMRPTGLAIVPLRSTALIPYIKPNNTSLVRISDIKRWHAITVLGKYTSAFKISITEEVALYMQQSLAKLEAYKVHEQFELSQLPEVIYTLEDHIQTKNFWDNANNFVEKSYDFVKEKDIVEFLVKIRIAEYPDAIERGYFWFKKGAGVKLRAIFYESAKGIPDIIESSINIESIKDKKLSVGMLIIPKEHESAYANSGIQLHMCVYIEDPNDCNYRVILGYLTSKVEGFKLQLSKTQPLNQENEKEKNKAQMFHKLDNPIRIVKEQINTHKKGTEYVNSVNENNESITEKIRAYVIQNCEVITTESPRILDKEYIKSVVKKYILNKIKEETRIIDNTLKYLNSLDESNRKNEIMRLAEKRNNEIEQQRKQKEENKTNKQLPIEQRKLKEEQNRIESSARKKKKEEQQLEKHKKNMENREVYKGHKANNNHLEDSQQ